eukprot:6003970-Prymnesium_polylepis.1
MCIRDRPPSPLIPTRIHSDVHKKLAAIPILPKHPFGLDQVLVTARSREPEVLPGGARRHAAATHGSHSLDP